MADLCVALGFMEVACQRMNAEVEELKKRSDKKMNWQKSKICVGIVDQRS